MDFQNDYFYIIDESNVVMRLKSAKRSRSHFERIEQTVFIIIHLYILDHTFHFLKKNLFLKYCFILYDILFTVLLKT